MRHAGDDNNGSSTDDEPHLGADHRTLYFSSDRVIPAHFPRSPEQAQLEFKRLGWFVGVEMHAVLPDEIACCEPNKYRGKSNEQGRISYGYGTIGG